MHIKALGDWNWVSNDRVRLLPRRPEHLVRGLQCSVADNLLRNGSVHRHPDRKALATVRPLTPDPDFEAQLMELMSVGGRIWIRKKRYAKVGRNERCPCGSGLKWKRCHGR